jgi:hypothetical protein
MEKSTKIAQPTRKNRRNLLLSFFFFFILNASTQLIDQTVALVGKRILTLQDLIAFKLVRNAFNGKKLNVQEFKSSSTEIASAREGAVKAALIRNYLTATGLRATIPEKDLARLKKSVEPMVSPSQELSQDDIDRAITDFAFEEDFFKNHFAPQQSMTREMLRTYYEENKESRFLGKSFASVENLVRASLRKELNEAEFQQWYLTETKRTEVVLLPLTELTH